MFKLAFNYRFLIFCVFTILLSACGSDTASASTTNESTIGTSENQKESTGSDQAQTTISKLIGQWERISYPYDQITFRASEMKYKDGEGAAEPAKFAPYSVANSCKGESREDGAYLVRDDGKLCTPFQLAGDQLTLFYPEGGYEIKFQRMVKNGDLSLPKLTKGFYVLEEVDCDNPPNYAWRYWTGSGLRGSATKDCQLSIKNKSGNTYSLSQDCLDTYNKTRSTSNLKITFDSQSSFVLNESGKEQRFIRCDQIPEWYEE